MQGHQRISNLGLTRDLAETEMLALKKAKNLLHEGHEEAAVQVAKRGTIFDRFAPHLRSHRKKIQARNAAYQFLLVSRKTRPEAIADGDIPGKKPKPKALHTNQSEFNFGI